MGIKRIIHYLLYPMWLVFYNLLNGLSLEIETDESGSRKIERTTFKYEEKVNG